MFPNRLSRWACTCRANGVGGLCRIPPSPEVMAEMFMEFRGSKHFGKLSFKKYLEYIGFVDPASTSVGMDNAAQLVRAASGLQLVAIPSHPVTGRLEVKVLLVEFPDRSGVKPPQHYRDMLFSQGIFPSGSMRDYYTEVSGGKVTVTGEVHGWLKMPQAYGYYTNGESGTQWDSYPNNAPRLAEDAVRAALAAGVVFESSLDKFEQGVITALFIVHAGRGAEVMPRARQGSEIWSHKWMFRTAVDLPSGLSATTYLVVPNDCKVGVCAHELGHLAFQWQDFYDPNYAEDGQEWDGSGVWDLMAGGSYNGDGARPAHPAALHKLQHRWIQGSRITKSGRLTLQPYSATGGKIYKIVGPGYCKGPDGKDRQYLLLENRKRQGFDFHLPGEGLLVWKIDEISEMNAPNAPGMSLIQADGRGDLESPDDWNQGDADDPFPGGTGKTRVEEVATSFEARSGVRLDGIAIDADGVVSVDVVIASLNELAVAKAPGTRRQATISAKQREAARQAFAAERKRGSSISASCASAGISKSSYYAWNKGDSWSKGNGWSK